MPINIRIISTKILTSFQIELLKNFYVDEVNLIHIDYNTSFKTSKNVTNVVFTSKNGVIGFFNKYSPNDFQFNQVYCVGDKTANLLNEKNIKITSKKASANELAMEIVKNKTMDEVHFFCGNLRRNELSQILLEHDIKINEIEVYATKLTPVKIKNSYDGILFFSPSSVKSYFLENINTQSVAFCIGRTTSFEANKNFKYVEIAEKPTIESVIELVNQYFDNE